VIILRAKEKILLGLGGDRFCATSCGEGGGKPGEKPGRGTPRTLGSHPIIPRPRMTNRREPDRRMICFQGERGKGFGPASVSNRPKKETTKNVTKLGGLTNDAPRCGPQSQRERCLHSEGRRLCGQKRKGPHKRGNPGRGPWGESP